MLIKACSQCGKDVPMFPCRAKKAEIFFCNKSCHRVYKNNKDNPSWSRDLSGENNPMYGKHYPAWNKGLLGEKNPNWKGGISKRKDGYVRITVDGKRELLHRFLLKDKLKEGNVVHHKDHNPSNNSLENLMVLENQSEHVKYERTHD